MNSLKAVNNSKYSSFTSCLVIPFKVEEYIEKNISYKNLIYKFSEGRPDINLSEKNNFSITNDEFDISSSLIKFEISLSSSLLKSFKRFSFEEIIIIINSNHSLNNASILLFSLL